MRRRRLEHDQPGAAARARLVVGDEVVRRQVVLDERRLVRRRDDAARQLDRPEPQRLKEARRARSNASRSVSVSGRERPVARSRATSTASASAESSPSSVRISSASVMLDVPIRTRRQLTSDGVVVLRQLAPEVDRHARQHVVPDVADARERLLDPLVAALLEVRGVDGVVDVLVRVAVAPPDLDPLLVGHADDDPNPAQVANSSCRLCADSLHRATISCGRGEGRGRTSSEPGGVPIVCQFLHRHSPSRAARVPSGGHCDG